MRNNCSILRIIHFSARRKQKIKYLNSSKI